MRAATEPVIVVIHPPSPRPRSVVLADVLVVVGGGEPPSSGWYADTFVRYPGLTLLLVVGPTGEIRAHFRDGILLRLSTTQPSQPSREWIAAVAKFLYFSWASGSVRRG